MSFKSWENCTLGDLVTFQRGHDLPKSNIIEGKYPVIASNGIIASHYRFTTKAPCITIGRSGSVGTAFFVNKDSWAHNTTLYIKEFHNNDPKFIYYYLKILNLRHYAGGSAVPTLNRNHIHPINVYVPTDTYEQRRIATILSALDDKIELNNRMNKILEQMAQAIFKQWFIDFEFPNENGDPYKSSGGEMEWCEELGKEIPMSWRIGKASDILDVLSGGTPKTDNGDFWNGSIPFFTPKDCSNSFYSITTEKSITKEGLKKCNSKLYPIGTVFITARGTVGKLSMAGCEMAMNQSCYALKAKDG